MNLIKERRSVGAICPRCSHPDYNMLQPLPRDVPTFTCTKCNTSWTYGRDGGKFKELYRYEVNYD